MPLSNPGITKFAGVCAAPEPISVEDTTHQRKKIDGRAIKACPSGGLRSINKSESSLRLHLCLYCLCKTVLAQAAKSYIVCYETCAAITL